MFFRVTENLGHLTSLALHVVMCSYVMHVLCSRLVILAGHMVKYDQKWESDGSVTA